MWLIFSHVKVYFGKISENKEGLLSITHEKLFLGTHINDKVSSDAEYHPTNENYLDVVMGL